MENTGKLLFDHQNEKYFIVLQGKAVGPMSAQEVYEKLQSHQIQLIDFFWQEGWSDWKRICDEKEFNVLLPAKPTIQSIEQIKAHQKQKKEAQAQALKAASVQYYLYFNKTQSGPFSSSELMHIFKSGRVNDSAYVWAAGWPNWKRSTEVEEFRHLLNTTPPTPPMPSFEAQQKISVTQNAESQEKRMAPRRPLVARLFLHNDQDVIIAICRDISIGGMQVLTDRIPGTVGSTIKLNVSPGDPNQVKGFVAEGEIVRILEDGRGFSFRFTKISDEAQKAIKNYIQE